MMIKQQINHYDLTKLIKIDMGSYCPLCGMRVKVFSNGAGATFWEHFVGGQTYAACEDGSFK